MRKFFSGNTLLCFSPPVMLATIIIELGLAAWVFSRYAVGTTRRLLILILICLSAFQLAEFNVCGATVPDLIWSRIGYVFITILPPLGLHLVLKLRDEQRPALLGASYGLAALFAGAFAFLPSSLNQGVCTGNYVIFLLSEPLAFIYMVYYFAFVGIGLWLTFHPFQLATKWRRQSLSWMMLGYLAFTLPVLIIVFILPHTRLGIPSIMCGFAVLFALILGLKVAPLIKESPTRRSAGAKTRRMPKYH